MYGLEQEDIDKIIKVFKNHAAIEKAILYGSRAKGNYKPYSDIDITLVGKTLTLSQQFEIETEIDDLLLPYKMDISIFHKIENQDLIDHINRVGMPFYENNSTFAKAAKSIITGWEEALLSDYIKVKHGFAFKGKFITSEETDDILITPGNFNVGGGFKNKKFKYYTDSYPEEYILQKDDMVITMTDLSKESDTLGYPARIPIIKGKRLLHNQRIGLVQFLNNEIDRDFLYWALRTREYHWHIVGSASGTAIMHTSPGRIGEYEFMVPPIPEQKEIGSVLTSLEKKIHLLNKQNKVLDRLSKTLFRELLVERIDENWEEVSLSSIATFLNGLACQKHPPKNVIDKLPVLKIRELKGGFSESSDFVSTEVDEKYLVQNGDVIFSWSASLVVKIWDGDDCILNQHLFKVTSERFPKWFYYLWSKYHLDMFIAIAKAHATTMGHIKRGDLDDAMVVIPPSSELAKMSKTFTPLIDKIIANNKQIKQVEKLRDTLLPKLMSGEVRVKI